MFGSLGFQEILIILALALLIFGPRKLPELGRMVGKGMREFRRATNDLRSTIEGEIADYENAVNTKPGPPKTASPSIASATPPPDTEEKPAD